MILSTNLEWFFELQLKMKDKRLFSKLIIISLENTLKGKELSQATTHTLQFTYISHPAGNCKTCRKSKTHLSCLMSRKELVKSYTAGQKTTFKNAIWWRGEWVFFACLFPCKSQPFSETFMPLPSFKLSPSSLSSIRIKVICLSYNFKANASDYIIFPSLKENM